MIPIQDFFTDKLSIAIKAIEEYDFLVEMYPFMWSSNSDERDLMRSIIQSAIKAKGGVDIIFSIYNKHGGAKASYSTSGITRKYESIPFYDIEFRSIKMQIPLVL